MESARFASSTTVSPPRAMPASMPHREKSSRSSTPMRAPTATGSIIWSKRSSAATLPPHPARISPQTHAHPRAAAMAAAPGLPREVRAGDDRLAQLCGCNMAITKAALQKAGGFDPMFTTAGDDVDLSWRLAASNETLAYAPGAVVIHERRATLSAYLRQQRGYGAGRRPALPQISPTHRRPGRNLRDAVMARLALRTAPAFTTASSAAASSRPSTPPATRTPTCR